MQCSLSCKKISIRCLARRVIDQPRALPQHELSVLLYTSGTTGMPKGVMLSSHNCIYNSIQGIAEFATSPEDKALCALPLFHSFMQNACVWSPCLIGGTVIVVPKIDRKMLLAAIAKKPTVVFGNPPAVWFVLSDEKY